MEHGSDPRADGVPEATVSLIQRIRAGDGRAKDVLFSRYLPLLRRWAHGRLPLRARDAADTDDLVQVTLIRALNNVHEFDVRHPGSFLAYLRQILLNEVRSQIRKSAQNLPNVSLSEDTTAADAPVIIEQLIGSERLDAYQAALNKLPRRQQELLVMRIEFGMTYPEIALETDSTPDAVRVMATRAAALLARKLGALDG